MADEILEQEGAGAAMGGDGANDDTGTNALTGAAADDGGTEAAAGDGAAAEGAEQGTPGAEGEGDAAQPDGKPKKTGKSLQDRFNELTAEKHAERRAREAAEARLRELEAASAGQAAGEGQGDGAEPAALTEAEIERRAEQKVWAREFNAACERTYEAGVAALGEDFDKARTNLVKAFGNELAKRVDILEVINETPDGHRLFHHLGMNIDQAEKIYALPPHKAAIELTKMAQTLAKPASAAVSSAPAPVKPVVGVNRGEPDINDPNLPMDQWAKLRDQQVHARRTGRAA